jgi:O-antigen biosynthesis protein
MVWAPFGENGILATPKVLGAQLMHCALNGKMLKMAHAESPERRQQSRGIESTGERYLPWANDPVCAYEHLHRYAYISRYVKGKKVLDLASGEGYGTALLARTAGFAVGIDIDKKAVQHASKKYFAQNLRFILGSITDIPLTARFDVIICFEAVEHIRAHEKLLDEVKRLLAPDGLFVISTPNKSEYRTQEGANPFHVKELDFEEFRALLTRHFGRVQFFGQRVHSGSSLWPCETKQSGAVSGFFIDRADGEFLVSEAAQPIPLYYIGIASNAAALPQFSSEVLLDNSNALMKVQEQALAWREEQVKQMERSMRFQEKALEWRASQIEDLQARMESITSGRAWRFIQAFMRIRDLAFPRLSRRRRAYSRFVQNIHF